jgi:hypothetical protein
MSARVAGDPGMVEALRARRSKGKEPIEREAMQDGRLSMKARGILGYLVSKPDKWRTNAQAIADTCDRDGRESISTGLKELEEKGYLARRKRHGSGGQFVWCWIYSDDPDEVAEVLAAMFPDDGEAKPAARRGRARKPRLGGETAGPAMNGKPVDGLPVDGAPVDGSSVDGEPVDIERSEEEIPPSPPQSGGDMVLPAGDEPTDRCATHGRTRCRPCGLSPRVQAWAERDRSAAEQAAAERAGEACGMCKADGPRSDGQGTRWVRVIPGTQEILVPYVICQHDKPHREVVAELAAAELAAERARAERPVDDAPSSTSAARAAARALAGCKPPQPRPRRVRGARRGAGLPDPRGKGGQEKEPAAQFDHGVAV